VLFPSHIPRKGTDGFFRRNPCGGIPPSPHLLYYSHQITSSDDRQIMLALIETSQKIQRKPWKPDVGCHKICAIMNLVMICYSDFEHQ